MDRCPRRGLTLLPEGNPCECLPESLLFHSDAEHLSHIKAGSAPRLKDPHLQERMASAEMRTPLASFSVHRALPRTAPESEDRVAIWWDHKERCEELKGEELERILPRVSKEF